MAGSPVVVRPALLALATFALLEPGQAASRIQPTSVQTLPVSDAVLATIATHGDSLLLMVLWRGSPRWFLAGGSHGGSGGGQGGVVAASFRFGSRTLDVTFDNARRLLSIQGKAQRIADDANVVLVDDADAASGPRVVGTLTVPADAESVDPVKGRLVPFFKRSKELVAFLQCDDGRGTAPGTPFARIVCDELRGQ